MFGIWSGILLAYLFATGGFKAGTDYIDGRNFTEPLFVIAIMVVAASKPVLHVAKLAVTGLARLLPVPRTVALYWLAAFLSCLGRCRYSRRARLCLAGWLMAAVSHLTQSSGARPAEAFPQAALRLC